MNPPVTTHTGPLGSTLRVLRADAGTVAALAAIDWNRHFSLVGLDPVRGLITLMSASHRHGLWSVMLDDIVDIAGSTLTGASRGLRHSRLRGQGEPFGTGVEPDGSYYLGERVGGYIAALTAGDEAADAFFERTPPDLAYEVELMDAATKARSNATPSWECGSCGSCTPARAPGTSGWSFSRCAPDARHAGSTPPKCSKDSLRRTCTRRRRGRGSA